MRKTKEVMLCMGLLLIGGSIFGQCEIANYPLNGNVSDITLNGHDGTVNGAISDGTAYQFDGIDDYITLNGGIPFVQGAFEVSVAATVTGTGYQPLFFQGQTDLRIKGPYIYLAAIGEDGKIVFSLSDKSHTHKTEIRVEPTTFDPNFDRANLHIYTGRIQNNGFMELLVDGNVVGSATIPEEHNLDFIQLGLSNEIFLGKKRWIRLNRNSEEEFLEGSISNVTILGNSLSRLSYPSDGEIEIPTWTSFYVVEEPGATNYELEYSTDADFPISTVISQSSADKQFDVECLEYATTYFVRVKSDQNNCWGRTMTFSTIDAPRANITFPLNNAVDRSMESYIHTNIADNNVDEILFEFFESGALVASVKRIKDNTKNNLCKFQVDRNTVQLMEIEHNTMTPFLITMGEINCSSTYDVIVTHTTNNNVSSISSPVSFSTEDCASMRSSVAINAGSSETDQRFDVYPNPFTNGVNVKVTTEIETMLSITVTDLAGKVISTSNDFTTNTNIQVGEELENGIYLIQLSYQDRMEVVRIVKR